MVRAENLLIYMRRFLQRVGSGLLGFLESSCAQRLLSDPNAVLFHKAKSNPACALIEAESAEEYSSSWEVR
jgi:hypothetical protein